MLRFNIKEFLGGLLLAAGAETGHRHAELISAELSQVEIPEDGLIVFFDFSDVEHVTASYIKNVLVRFTLCGQLHAGALAPEQQRSGEWSFLKPLNVFPVVLNANAEVRHEINEVFGRRGLACVAAESTEADAIAVGKVLGIIDPAAARTLRALEGFAEATANDLYQKFPNDGVNITAWNNRLLGLNRSRIARRRRAGKFWKYQPLAGVMTYG
jgi:hypothetical protein